MSALIKAAIIDTQNMFTDDLRQRDATHYISRHPEGLLSQDMGVRPGWGGYPMRAEQTKRHR